MKPPKSLPWMMYDAPEDGEFGAEYEVGTTFGSKKDRAENAAYIVHAANAYPRLVEHLKAVADTATVQCGGVMAVTNPFAAPARSLLQELGEGP